MTLILLGLAWVSGLVAVGAWSAPWWMGAAWMAAAAPALVAFTGLRGRWLLLCSCVVAAGIAGWLLERDLRVETPEWLAFAGDEVTLTGSVDSEPDRGLTVTSYVLRVDSIERGEDRFRGGKVLVHLHQYARHLPGDRLTLRGNLELPPTFDTFDYRAYLLRQDISAVMLRPRVMDASEGGWSPGRALTDLRLRLDRGLARSLPEPEASLAAGIAFGREDGLSNEAKGEYNRAGLRHLVAVSGSNVVLVAAVTSALAVPLIGRRWAWIPAAATVGLYLAAAGLAPSVVRAGIMAGVLLFGMAIGRPQSGMPALAAAVIAMTALSPPIATDAGFQLSATATAGLIAFSPWLSAWLLAASARLHWAAPPAWVCEAGSLTLAATIATLPITWVTFGRVSLVSPVANVLAQPAFAAAFCLSVLTAVVSTVSTPGGEALGVAAYYPLAFIGWLAQWAGSQQFATVGVPGAGPTAAVSAYAVLALPGGVAYRFRPSQVDNPAAAKRRRRAGRVLALGAAGASALAVLPISFAPRSGPGELVVDFLDVGQGDAVLITTPHGRQLLIDGGPSGLELARELGATMPHWDRRLDAVMLSHPQEDHLAGLPELAARFAVGTVYDAGNRNDTVSFALYAQLFPMRNHLATDSSFELDGVRFEVLWPPPAYQPEDLNDSSLVVRMTYGEVAFLFTGDSQAEAHATFTATGVRADVLKVPHHGSKTTDPDFFAAVDPTVAVILVGGDNQFGHPHEATIEALRGVPTYRTDLSGRITVRTDGRQLSVGSER